MSRRGTFEIQDDVIRIRERGMKAIRRLGDTPAKRGDTTNVSGSPDILELDDGSFAVIGVDITDELGRHLCQTRGALLMSGSCG
jgi:hypothetical protein